MRWFGHVRRRDSGYIGRRKRWSYQIGGHAGIWSRTRRYREQVKMENGDSQLQPMKSDKPK